MLFTVDGFIGLCQEAVGAADAEKNMRELVAESISDPERVIAELPKPEHAGFEVLPLAEPDHSQLFLGSLDVFQAAQPLHVVGRWHLFRT